jgi:alkylhydroperoxidase family enzyme
LLDLNNHAASPAFDEREKLALELTDAISGNPAHVSEDLFTRLSAKFKYEQIVDLAAAIAFENYRSRFNRVFGVESAGFSQGSFCPMPVHKIE